MFNLIGKGTIGKGKGIARHSRGRRSAQLT